MKINLTGRHVDITDGLRSHAESRMEHLDKYKLASPSAHVILAVEKHRQSCEIVLTAKKTRVAAEAHGPDLYAAMDEAVERVETQLRKHKERFREGTHKHVRVRGSRPNESEGGTDFS